MLAGFYKIVEERIRQAQRKGEFENLSGHGEPLNLEYDSGIAGDLRLAHKILKNAGFLPPEVELRKKITKVEQLLGETGYDSKERSKIQKKTQLSFNKTGHNQGRITLFPGAHR